MSASVMNSLISGTIGAILTTISPPVQNILLKILPDCFNPLYNSRKNEKIQQLQNMLIELRNQLKLLYENSIKLYNSRFTDERFAGQHKPPLSAKPYPTSDKTAPNTQYNKIKDFLTDNDKFFCRLISKNKAFNDIENYLGMLNSLKIIDHEFIEVYNSLSQTLDMLIKIII